MKHDELAQLMALACTHWGWSPEAFWQATPGDLRLIAAGLARLQEAAVPPGALSRRETEELRRLIDNHAQRTDVHA